MNLMMALWLWPLLLTLTLLIPAAKKYTGTLITLALIPAMLLWLAQLSWLAPRIMPVDALYLPSFLLGFHLVWHELSFIWLSFNILVWALAAWHSHWVKVDNIRYPLFMTLSLSGSLGLVVAGDALSFYLFFSLMSLAAWGLVVHERTPVAERAASWYIMLAILGETLLLSGLLLRAAELGSTDLMLWLNTPSGAWGMMLIALGMGFKLGAPLLHVWLPLAHSAAPTPASAILSGVMIKAGILGLWLLLPSLAMPLTDNLFMAVAWLGGLAMLYGVVMGLTQTYPKTILAYSSISQMGWLVWGLSWVWQTPDPRVWVFWVALFAWHHALVKSALFIGFGWHKFATSMTQAYIVLAGLVVLALVLAGAPLTAGAWLKYGMKLSSEMEAVVATLPLWWLSIASGATLLLMIHFIRCLVSQNGFKAKPVSGELKSNVWHDDSAFSAWLALLLLIMLWPLLLLTGWFTQAVNLGNPAWQAFVPVSLVDGSMIQQAWLPLFMALLLALAWRFLINRQFELPAGDVLVFYAWSAKKLAHYLVSARGHILNVKYLLLTKKSAYLKAARLPAIMQTHKTMSWFGYLLAWLGLLVMVLLILTLAAS
ncbi:NADH-ubiquinone oxidoreductase [Thiomicrospira aerophila AL3]|uniref:NADH-ubiquinone oxidoreductase n=1 Tax=Thiomicrospira aerophila AL3 TaxID=717772 RepID=W0DU89_9GAMM|nr:complex I subunit 5 family protein [Thiomicrospira aerophila]AHF00833.1 NADH-ubiquinone oxidoreductase [Thiomicrospira aerophila AL3]